MRVRPGTWDAQIVNSVFKKNEYNLPADMRGMTVLDIGAHIGSFAAACIMRGAKRVICYEPDPENFKLLIDNCNTAKIQSEKMDHTLAAEVTLMEGAVSGKAYGKLWLRRLTDHDFGAGRNTGHVDVFGSELDSEIQVDSFAINSILEQAGPIDFLKIDCEGAEWSIFGEADLKNVKRIACELHPEPYRKVSVGDLSEQLIQKLETEGFDVRVYPTSPVTSNLSAVRRSTVAVEVLDKPKILWIGDAAVTTGYGRVTEAVCTRLNSNGWDVNVLGVGYNGDPHNMPFKIYPAVNPNTGGHPNGLSRLAEIVKKVKPQAVIILDDSWNAGIIADNMAMNNIWSPSIGYIAVDSENVRADVAANLRNLKHVICHTEFGVRQLKLAGYSGSISVAGHGVDTSLYTVYDKREAREGIDFQQKVDRSKAFIWGVVAANQPRKRLDLTIAYFAAWWNQAGKPENAYLYLHTNMEGTYDLAQLADYYGVRGRLLSTKVGPTLLDEYIPTLYNCFDAMISTAEGESWGLPVLEGMACGVPQIALRCAGLAAWADDAVLWVQPENYTFIQNRVNAKRWTASEQAYVGAMNKMWYSPELREACREAGLAMAKIHTWESVANHFDATLKQMLSVQKRAAHADTDCLAEF